MRRPALAVFALPTLFAFAACGGGSDDVGATEAPDAALDAPVDVRHGDAAPSDAANIDAPADAGPADATPDDAANVDAPVDVAPADATPGDATNVDAPADVTPTDAAPKDGDVPDAVGDAASGDGGSADAGAPDAMPTPAYGTFTAVRKDTAAYPTPPPYGHYLYLPSTYDDDPSKLWPTIVFFPGTGEFGNGTTELGKVLLRGLPKVIDKGTMPAPAYHQFVVVAAQNTGYPSVADIDTFFAWIDGHYRIDPKRRYLTGLSAGGITTWSYGRNGGKQVAAYVPFSAKNGAGTACAFASRPIWIFHGKLDSNANTPVSGSIDGWNAVNACSPAEPARLTVITNGGHDDLTWVPIWDLTAMTAGHIDPTYDPYDQSIYDWLLKHHL